MRVIKLGIENFFISVLENVDILSNIAFLKFNEYALAIDYEKEPPMFQVSDTHYAKTWLLHPDAPKISIPEVVARRIEAQKQGGTM